MEIRGREIGFRRTVLATCELADISPNKDVNKFDKLLNSKEYAVQQKAAAAFIVALSKGFEMARTFDEPGYKANPLTVDEVLCLDDETFTALFVEALKVWTGDATLTVETEAPKGKNAERDSE